MPSSPSDPKRALQYVESLLWRQRQLTSDLSSIRGQLEELDRLEAGVTIQLRAVEQLLAAEEGADGRGRLTKAPSAITTAGSEVSSVKELTLGDEGGADAIDWSLYSAKSRRIYTAAAKVLREAGIPLHYRILAEEVQKQVPLAGSDPGATLIAHFHRAKDLFPRMGRGIYGLHGVTPPIALAPTRTTMPVTRAKRARRSTTRRRPPR